MSISAVGACSPATQLQSTQYTSRSAQAAPAQHANSPFDGGAFIDAIASALKEIGATAQSDGSGSATSDSGGEADPAQALGDFLHSLINALHGQGGAGGPPGGGPPAGGPTAGGPPGAPPPGGAAGGPTPGGGIKSELQSLIASLSSSATDDTGTTSDVDSTASLATSFKNLVSALGLNSESGTASKLGEFLQALSNNLEGARASGNLVNTTA